MQQTILERIKENTRDLSRAIDTTDFGYVYTGINNFRPGSVAHDFIVERILEWATQAKRLTDSCAYEWAKLTQNVESFVPYDAEELKLKQLDPRKPIRIVIPISYMAREIWTTYMASTFLNNPIHAYQPVSANDVIGAIKMERCVALQSHFFREGLGLMGMWKDSYTYGIGPIHNKWRVERRPVISDVEVDALLASIHEETGGNALGLKEGDVLRFAQEQIVMEGNVQVNIDPFRMLLNPKTPIVRFQDSEWCGYHYDENVMNLLREEAEPENRMMNCKYVRVLASQGCGGNPIFDGDRSGRGMGLGIGNFSSPMQSPYINNVNVIRLFAWIIPYEWGLSMSQVPEMWEFGVAAGRVLIQCHQVPLIHRQFPIIVAAPNTNNHDIIPVSHLATGFGLQETADFEINAKTANSRKAVNDMIIFDPSVINEDDMMNPGPGKLIRMHRGRYGTGKIDDFVKQLAISDVTRQNMNDVQQLMDLHNQTLGINDMVQGNLSKMPERPTKGGINMMTSASLSRFQKDAQMLGLMVMTPLGYQIAYNTQQFMNLSVWVEMMGRNDQALKQVYPDAKYVAVDPRELNVNFCVKPSDATMPGTQNVESQTQVLQTLLQAPGVIDQVVRTMDVPRYFMDWARNTGAKNVTDFMRNGGQVQVQPMDDARLAQQIDQGNLRPATELAGAGAGYQ